MHPSTTDASAVWRPRTQPEGSSSLVVPSEDARTDTIVEEGSSRQQDTRDDADASSLVLLLSAAVLSVRDKPPGLSLLIPEGAGWDEEEDGAVGEVEEGSRSRGMTWTRHLSCICSPLLFSVSATRS